FASKVGNKIQRLWHGNTEGYPSPSEADEALCSYLAWWTQKDASEIDRLFRLSGLYRGKWDDDKYRTRTIAKALDQAGQYDPAWNRKLSRNRSVTETEPQEERGNVPTLDIQALLDELTATQDAGLVWNSLDELASLSMSDWSQFKTACKAILKGDLNLNDLDKARSDARRKSARTTSGVGSMIPEICISTDMRDVVDQAQAAIISQSATPDLFSRSGALVFIAQAGTTPTALIRPPDSPMIASATKEYLRERMSSSAQFLKYDKTHDDWVPALPPEWVPGTLQARGTWDFFALEGILSSPTMCLDGSILNTPGYDTMTGLFLMGGDVRYPPVPDQPAMADAQHGVKALTEVFQDFPFQHPYHASAAIAAVLSLVGRYAINGNVPLFAVSASTRGAGKGKLVDAISVIATGRTAPLWPETTDDEEERKRILTLAMEGDTLVLLDNLTQPLGSAALDAALTSPTFKDRVLGKSQSKEAPLSAVFFATGNNLTYKGDITRRVIPIYLESEMERPEEREDFLHPNLTEWLHQERPRLVSAALTILRAYHVAGRPKQPGIKQIGSFEAWNDLVRSALIWAGQPDPAEGRRTLEAENDMGYDELLSLLDGWEACYGSGTSTLNAAIDDIAQRLPTNTPTPDTQKWRDLRDALGAFDPRYDGKGLHGHLIGNRLNKIQRRVIDHRQFQREARTKYGFPWKVTRLTPAVERSTEEELV
ncbi:MAG: hypothetical protein V3S24_10110, partial [Candidatus Tectomicrobia bacterium]